MPSTFSNLGLELQATGENANTWGDKTNVGLQRVDNAIAGYTTVQANSTTITLAFSTNSGSTTFTDENGRNKILKFTSGTAAAAITVTVPDIEKEYLVRNETGQNVTFSAGGSTTITLATGKNAHIYIDGASAVYNSLADIVTTSLDTGAITTTGITTTGDINFGDNDKANFGAGNDLQIYHDGSHSYISDQGTGNLVLQASNSFKVENSGGTETYIFATENGAVELKHDNATKIATTSTGVDVTGKTTTDSIDAVGGQSGSTPIVKIENSVGDNLVSFKRTTGTPSDEYAIGADSTALHFKNSTLSTYIMSLNEGGNVGIGETSPSAKLEVVGDVLIPETTLTDGATISWDVSTKSVAKVTLGGNRTISAPSNAAGAGQFVSLLVIQDGTGTRTLTWNAVYEFKDDTAPTLTSTGGKGDLFVFRYNGTKWLEVGRNLNLTLS